jgi:AraC family transcriptional regulator
MGFIEQLLEYIPPHPLKDTVNAYPGENMVIFKPKIIFEGPFCSQHYQFFLPLSEVPPIVVDKKTFHIEKNKLFPINPEQFHGATKQSEVTGYLTVLINRETLREMAHSAFGKSDVSFENNSIGITHEAWNMINQYMTETAYQQQGYRFIQEGLTLQLVINLLRNAKSNLRIEKSDRSRPLSHIRKAIEFMNDCYNEDCSIEEIARAANLSPYHFIRVFKAETGMTPHGYLLNIKLSRIKEKLADRDLSISQAFSLCGLNYNGHYASVFKKKEGVTPSQYRKAMLGPTVEDGEQ